MSPPEALLDLAVRVAGQAAAGEEVEAYVSRGHHTEVVAHGGEVESLSSADTAGVGVRVVRDHRQGFAWSGSLEEDAVAGALAEARDNASFAHPDPHLGLAAPDGVAAAPIDPWSDEVATFALAGKVEMALDLERRVLAGDTRIRTLRSASYDDGRMEAAVATSTGIATTYRRTGCSIAASAIAGDGGDTQTGTGYSVARGPGGLDVEEAAADAVERSTRLLGAGKPRSARLTAVLDPRVTATLLAVLSGILNGESVLKGRSLFAGRVGEQVAVPGLTLVDDPTDDDAFGASAFDAEGLACRRNRLIEDGVLQGFLYDTYAGRRAGLASNGCAVRGGFRGGPGAGARAVSVVPGSASAAEVLAQVGNGVLVQAVSGVHSGVNPVSGDFSVGAEGVMVRAGALAEPVREITVASTLQRMLQSVVAVGGDVEWLPGSAAGLTLAIADVSMSGA